MDNMGQLMLAAYIFHGVLENPPIYERARQRVAGCWGQVEICYEVVAYAPFMEEMYQALSAKLDVPGVIEYEVAKPFGKWWAYWTGEADVPSVEQCHAHIAQLMEECFTMQGRSEVEQVKDAISDFFTGRQASGHEASSV